MGSSPGRLRGALLALAFIFSLFLGRLVQLQGLDASGYAEAAQKSRMRHVPLMPSRGPILDSSGAVLATTVERRTLTVDQKLIHDETTKPDATTAIGTMVTQLSPLLRMDEATLRAKLTGERRSVVVAKDVEPGVWGEIQDLKPAVVGMFSTKTQKRIYPAGPVAANILGYVTDSEKNNGGLEGAENDLLSGKPGEEVYEIARGGAEIPVAPSTRVDPVPGTGLELTIDRDLQYVAQRAVNDMVEKYGGASGTAVVMDTSQNILAMATSPTFDPGHITKDDAVSDLGNRPLQDAYEPGSVGKLITAGALLDHGGITPATPITVPPSGTLRRGGKSFKDFDNHGTVHYTYAGTLARSSNMGTILAAEKALKGNFTQLYPYYRKFGFGTRLGLGLPGDVTLPQNPGSVLKPAQWSGTTPYTMVFGQGYSVNAVQMASMLATIANDGVRVDPRLVSATVAADGSTHPVAAPSSSRAISATAAQTIRTMMEAVVNPGGTAPQVAIPGYRIAGKTGTANRYDEKAGGYRGYTMSFGMIAPADKPKIVVYVVLQNPKVYVGGGAQAGPVARQILSYALQDRRIPPTGSASPYVPIYTDKPNSSR